MSWLAGLRHRLGALLRPDAWRRDLDDEIGHHLELETMHQGDPDAARRRFGNRTWHHEETRRMTWLRITDVLGQDARAAWRGMVRAPALTALIVVTLALGLGANGATFSLLDVLYVRQPGGVSDPATLRGYWIRHYDSGDGVPFTSQAMNYPMYRALVASSGAPAAHALYTSDRDLHLGRSLGGPRVRGVYATASYFQVLGVTPALGRLYTTAEDSLGAGAPVAVVSHAFWQRQLGGTASVLGSPLRLGPATYTVIGVLPPAFSGLELQAADVWIPLAAMPAPSWARGPWWESTYIYSFRAIARWQAGWNERAAAERATQALVAVEAAARGWQWQSQQGISKRPLEVQIGSALATRGPGEPTKELVIATRAGGVAAIVLIIAWANVINLLLARALSRRREIAVRLALGVSRTRLVVTLTMETLLLALLAGAAAMLMAWLGGTALRTLLLPEVEWQRSALDWRMAGFTALVALSSGLVAGLIPALQASRPVLTDALKAATRQGGHRRSRLRNLLVSLQAALAVTLLVGAALFVRSLRNVEALDIGYDSGRLIFGTMEFDEGAAPAPAAVDAATREVATRLQGRGDIEVAARSSITPMRGFSFMPFYSGADSAGSFPGREPTFAEVSPDFFRAAGITMLAGSSFADGIAAQPELVVNEALAKLLWPGQNAVGQCMRLQSRTAACLPVVGVVENVRQSGLIEPDPKPQFYLPLGNTVEGSPGWTVVVRAAPGGLTAASAALLGELRRAFPTGYPSVTPMTANLEPAYRPWRLGALLFTGFGLLALVVAMIGIYSTISYDVRQRTHEIGVRVALGARPADLLRQVIGEGLRIVLVGTLAGVALTLAAGRLVSAMLYGIGAADPVVLTSVAVLLIAVAALAAALPAWRATRVDPVIALRDE
jgi:predicted permease